MLRLFGFNTCRSLIFTNDRISLLFLSLLILILVLCESPLGVGGDNIIELAILARRGLKHPKYRRSVFLKAIRKSLL